MLRREFKISAHEAEYVIPAWEREMLLRLHMESMEEGSPDKSAGDLSAVPDELRGLS